MIETTERALVGNASDREQVDAADRVEKRILVSDAGARDAVMKTPEGRQFVWWLLSKCGVFESVLRGGLEMRDVYAGRQEFGHELMTELRHTPELYIQMQEEAMAREKHLRATTKPKREELADARAEA